MSWSAGRFSDYLPATIAMNQRTAFGACHRDCHSIWYVVRPRAVRAGCWCHYFTSRHAIVAAESVPVLSRLG
jgi:hypothetical protein